MPASKDSVLFLTVFPLMKNASMVLPNRYPEVRPKKDMVPRLAVPAEAKQPDRATELE